MSGVLYFTAPDHVWAVDARNGREMWHYAWKSKGGWHIGNRGAGVWGGYLYFETPDCNLVSLNHQGRQGALAQGNLRSGAVLLRLRRAGGGEESRDRGRQRRRSGHPRIHRVARSGNRRVAMALVCASEAGRSGSENLAQRGSHAARRRHDVGAGHVRSRAEPVLLRHRQSAAGDRGQGAHGRQSLYRVHHRAESGYRKDGQWYFQPSPHDTHDWDAVQTPVLFDGEINGQKRKLLAQASRNGWFFVLDRTNGKHIVSSEFVKTNWAKGVDAKGQPIPNPGQAAAARWRAGFTQSGRRGQLASAELRSRDRLVLRQRRARLQRLLHLRR